MDFEFGTTVRDKVTGFSGVAIAKCQHLTGCDQYSVQPPVGDDGKWIDHVWFDAHRLELVESDDKIELADEGKPGASCTPPSL